MPVFIRCSRMPAPTEDVFHWHARPGAFERLSPPWESVRHAITQQDIAAQAAG